MKKKNLNKILAISLFLVIILDASSNWISSFIPFIDNITNTLWAFIEGGILIGLWKINTK